MGRLRNNSGVSVGSCRVIVVVVVVAVEDAPLDALALALATACWLSCCRAVNEASSEGKVGHTNPYSSCAAKKTYALSLTNCFEIACIALRYILFTALLIISRSSSCRQSESAKGTW